MRQTALAYIERRIEPTKEVTFLFYREQKAAAARACVPAALPHPAVPLVGGLSQRGRASRLVALVAQVSPYLKHFCSETAADR